MSGLNSNTKLLLHCNGADGSKSHIITANNNAQIDTSEYRFGSSSLLLVKSTEDYLSVPDSSDFDVFQNTSDDWTVETFYKSNGGMSSEYLFSHGPDANNYWNIQISSGDIYLLVRSGGTNEIIQNVGSAVISEDTWTHIALVKTGNEYGIYIDGNQVLYVQSNYTQTFNGNLFIGARPDLNSARFVDGWMDGVRIQKGNYYNATPDSGNNDTISVPTEQHEPDNNTVLLMNFEGPNSSTNFIDRSGGDDSSNKHVLTYNGNSQLDTAQSKFGGASILFDGTGDYVSIPDSADWDVFANTTDDYTIDFWYKPNAAPSSTEMIFNQYEDGSNGWTVRRNSNGTLRVYMQVSGTPQVDLSSTATLTGTSWNHLAFVKVGDEYAIYLNGEQVAYVQDTSTATFSGPIHIGSRNGSFEASGHMDEIRIQKSNYFSASPDSGLNDTITVPTEEYSVFVPTPASQGIIII